MRALERSVLSATKQVAGGPGPVAKPSAKMGRTRRTGVVEDDDKGQEQEAEQKTKLELAAHAAKDELYPADKRDLVEIRAGTHRLFPFALCESRQAAGYAAHVSAEEALVLGRKRSVAVSHLGGLPGDRANGVAAGRTGAAAVHVKSRTGPASARDGGRAAGE